MPSEPTRTPKLVWQAATVVAIEPRTPTVKSFFFRLPVPLRFIPGQHMATHSPILMALPDARLLRLEKYGLHPVTLEDTDHYRMMREFILDPHGTVDTMLWE